jgi:hypothetical protein
MIVGGFMVIKDVHTKSYKPNLDNKLKIGKIIFCC